MLTVRRPGAIAVLPIVTACVCVVAGAAQVSGTVGVSRPISPAVMASWIASVESGPRHLHVLVLWRGTPGWFLATQGTGGGLQGWGRGGDGEPGPMVLRVVEGGVELEVRFDAESGTVQVQDQVVPLQDANVILVDHVDSVSGPQVVGTARVEPQFPAGRIGAALRSSPGLVSFLRCDVTVADEAMQKMMELLCTQTLGR